MLEALIGKKERADKKKDLNPTMPESFVNQIKMFATLCNSKTWREIGEKFCQKGIENVKVVEEMSSHFRFMYEFATPYTTRYFMGDTERPSYKPVFDGPTQRLHMRFHQEYYNKISLLSSALDVSSRDRATYLLLQTAFANAEIASEIMVEYVKPALTSLRNRQVTYLLSHLNAQSDKDIKLDMLLLHLYIGATKRRITLVQALEEYLDASIQAS